MKVLNFEFVDFFFLKFKIFWSWGCVDGKGSFLQLNTLFQQTLVVLEEFRIDGSELFVLLDERMGRLLLKMFNWMNATLPKWLVAGVKGRIIDHLVAHLLMRNIVFLPQLIDVLEKALNSIVEVSLMLLHEIINKMQVNVPWAKWIQ